MSAAVRSIYSGAVEQASGGAQAGAPAKERGPFAIKPAALRDPRAIPPRRWLYGRALIQGYITVLVAPGGVGKTAYSLAVACSMARGQGLIREWVYHRSRVLVCTLEDPEDEFDRRVAAVALHHDFDQQADLGDWLFVVAGRERRLTLASLEVDGFTVIYPDKEALVREVKAAGIGVIVVDPFINSHELDENNNPHVNAAARAWAEVASEAGCAVLLVHHTRKGAVAGDIEGSRGAKALTDAARVGLTLAPMTAEEAETFGIPERERRLHVRLDDAKANLSPPAEHARWFKLHSVPLHNGEPDTPWTEGDNVQALAHWEPPAAPVRSHSPDALNRALDAVEAGPGAGQRFGTRRSGVGGGARWCGRAVMDALGVGEREAASLVQDWLKAGALVERMYDDPQQRKQRSGVFVDAAKRPA